MNVNRLATIKIGEHSLSNTQCEKLLGFKINSQLNTNNLETIIKTVNYKVHDLARITPCESF